MLIENPHVLSIKRIVKFSAAVLLHKIRRTVIETISTLISLFPFENRQFCVVLLSYFLIVDWIVPEQPSGERGLSTRIEL